RAAYPVFLFSTNICGTWVITVAKIVNREVPQDTASGVCSETNPYLDVVATDGYRHNQDAKSACLVPRPYILVTERGIQPYPCTKILTSAYMRFIGFDPFT